jgi:hypothetical protein
MPALNKRRLRRKENLCPLPLFAWAAAQPGRTYPRTIARLSKRMGVSEPLALAIAEIAGIKVEAEHV